MGSRSSDQTKRCSERRKAEDSLSGDEREQGGGSSIAQSTYRASHHSSHSLRSRKTTRPIVVNNFNGNGNISFYNNAIGIEEEELPQSSRSPQGLSRSSLRLTPSKRKEKHVIPRIEESGSSDLSAGSSRESSPVPPSSSGHRRPNPSAPQSYRSDEGYHTRGSSTRHGKAKEYDALRIDNISSTASPSINRSRQKKSSRYELDGGSDDEVSVDDTRLAKEEIDGADGEDSDDEFNKRTIKLEGPHREEIVLRATLDTGTNPDWVSEQFLEKLKKKHSKLREDQNKEYKDFNEKKFKPIGTIELDIMCEDFQGFKCKKKTFLVAKNSSFDILLGKITIKEEKLLRPPPSDPSGENALPGVQSESSKEERLRIARRKEKQQKEAAAQAKKREEKRKMDTNAKERQLPSANLVSESKTARRTTHRKSRSRSPARKGRAIPVPPKSSKLPPSKEKSSLSSLEGTW